MAPSKKKFWFMHTEETTKALTIPVPRLIEKRQGMGPWLKLRREGTSVVWEVRLVASQFQGENKYRLVDGWEQFVNDNAIEFTDYVKFVYNGNSVFTVAVMTRYKREKCLRRERVNILPVPKYGPKPKWAIQTELSLALQLYCANSKFPYFIVHMTRGYVKCGSVGIPVEWVREHFPSMVDGQAVCASVVRYSATYHTHMKLYVKPNSPKVCKMSGLQGFFTNMNVKGKSLLAFELLQRSPDIVFKVKLARFRR